MKYGLKQFVVDIVITNSIDRAIESINRISFVYSSFVSNTGSTTGNPYWTNKFSRNNSLKLIEIFSINKVSLD